MSFELPVEDMTIKQILESFSEASVMLETKEIPVGLECYFVDFFTNYSSMQNSIIELETSLRGVKDNLRVISDAGY
jgi:hypothetical protein